MTIKKLSLIRFDSIRLDSTRLDSTRLDSTRLDSTRLDSTRLDSTRLDSTRLDSTRLDSTRLDSTRLDSTRLDSTRLDSTRLDSTRLDSTRLDSTRFDLINTSTIAHFKLQVLLCEMLQAFYCVVKPCQTLLCQTNHINTLMTTTQTCVCNAYAQVCKSQIDLFSVSSHQRTRQTWLTLPSSSLL